MKVSGDDKLTIRLDDARKTWRILEPLHILIYVAPEAATAYADLGLSEEAGYFASRVAPLGAVPAEVVISTFFNFCPNLVRRALDGAWGITTPARILDARYSAIAAAFKRILGSDIVESTEMIEAARLARIAAEAAGKILPGRPLFAAYSTMRWPEEPLLVLWHAQTLLREFRGDGHVAILTAEGVSACEALQMDAATGGPPAERLRKTRGWSQVAWQESADTLRARGWFDSHGTLTEAGRAYWGRIESRTDALAAPAFEPLGPEGCARLRELCRPWSRRIIGSGAFDAVTT